MVTKEQKDRYKKYLRSKAWAQLKIDLIQTRGQKCERCGSKRKQLRFLHIHHLTYKRLFDEEPEDLEILCAPCHRAEHNIGKKRKRDVNKKKSDKKKRKVAQNLAKITRDENKRNNIKNKRKRYKHKPDKCYAKTKKYSKPKRGSDVREKIAKLKKDGNI